MIQINLIPEVKQEYIRARRMRNIAISASIVTGIVAVGVVALLGVIIGTQAIYEGITDKNIDDEQAKFKNTPSINEAVTLQNQLNNISSVNSKKTVNSRLLDVLSAVNPKGKDSVKYTTVIIDPLKGTLKIEGVAQNGYPSVEKFVKTIKNTSIKYDDGQEMPLASSVQVNETSLGEDSSGKRVLSFEISIDHDTDLFSNNIRNTRIVSPERSIDVTDSRSGVPKDLFTNPANDIKKEGAKN